MGYVAVEQLDTGLWRWTARHPEWHPGAFGAEVGSFALRAGDDTILVDPLVPDGDEELERELDAIVHGSLTVVITIPYHVRSAATLSRRYGPEHPTEILGHAAARRRLPADAPFRAIAAGDELPHGMTAHAIGSPRRQELPIHIPGHRALAFGDAIVEDGGALRVWVQGKPGDERLDWYRRRLVPSLEPLLDLDNERVLVAHGSSAVLRDGNRALRDALDAPPWYHRG